MYDNGSKSRSSELIHAASADIERLSVCADLLLFTATANLSIVSLNLSLMLNRVGFYQASHTFYTFAAPCNIWPAYSWGTDIST